MVCRRRHFHLQVHEAAGGHSCSRRQLLLLLLLLLLQVLPRGNSGRRQNFLGLEMKSIKKLCASPQ
jgi:hypothetical protein